jgi:hypothetical protein
MGVEMIVKTRTMWWPVFAASQFALSRKSRGIGGALMKTSFALIVCLWAFQASAQQTYKAASCSQTDVQTAINNEIAHAADGDVITIPAGTCTWTGSTSVGANFTKSVTIQGAGAISATTGGASTTGTDQTVIVNHMSSNKPVMSFVTTAGKSFRFTGIAVIEDGGSLGPAYNGNVSIYGKSSAVRMDHCHFFIAVNGSKGPYFSGGVTGVADHMYINTNQAITNNFVFNNGASWGSDNSGFGNGSWADDDHFGTSQFIFVEDTRMDGGYGSDCVQGGRWVLRYSTAVNNNGMYEHGTHDQYRGCRAAEVYNNTFAAPQPFTDGGMVHRKSGPSLIFNNSVTNLKNVVDLDYYRINGVTYGISPAPPNGFGMCGNVTGGPSAWDGNSGSNGYPCLDLPGRGQGDLLTTFTTSFTGVLNSVTGTRSWPRQVLSPVYTWGNTLTGGNAITGNRIPVLTDNVDYYTQFGTLGEPGAFNGTAGIGQGSSAPSVAQPSCTPGATSLPAGTVWLGVPVSGKWGPGYWNTSNNTLYICTATNTWTAYYKPYTYPHPLTKSTTAAATAPTPPTGLTATVQ